MVWKRIIYILSFSAILILGCERKLSFDKYVELAEKYSSQGENEKAIDAYKKALQIKPHDSKAHYALGCLYYNEMIALTNKSATNSQEVELMDKEYKRISELATNEFKKVLEYDQANWRARYMVATDDFNHYRYQDAIRQYNYVIQYNPKDSNTYTMLSDAYLAIGNFDKAIKNINKSYQVKSDSERYYFYLAKVYYKQKKYDKGFELQMKLKNMNSNYYDDLLHFKQLNNIP